MITGKEKWLWLLSAMMLVLLFLASSTDLLIKEKRAEVYQISVIVGDATDENYMNFRKGMDQAALEYHADVRFVTLYNDDSWEQQMDMILREVRDGAQALVVAPADEIQAADMMLHQQIHVPMVFLNGEMAAINGSQAADLSFDYYELGQKLGAAVAGRHSSEHPVYLLGKLQTDAVSQEFEAGIRSVLEPDGYELRQCRWSEGRPFENMAAMLMEDAAQEPVVAALDPQSLLKMANMLADGREGDSCAAALYGRGTTVPILNYLGRGVITGLCVTDDFTAGYLSIRMTIEQIRDFTPLENRTLKSAYIEQEDLRKAAYEKMLYPIE